MNIKNTFDKLSALQRIRRQAAVLIHDRRGDAIGWLIIIVISVAVAGIIISLAVPTVRTWWESVAQRVMEFFNFS